MDYKGKIYGKVGSIYFPLVKTAEDVDKLEAEVLRLTRKLHLCRRDVETAKIENNERRLRVESNESLVKAQERIDRLVGALKEISELKAPEGSTGLDMSIDSAHKFGLCKQIALKAISEE